jgi:hypothetical protein
MSMCRATVIGTAAFVACASGADVLVLSSVDDAADNAMVQALEANGHLVTLGPAAHEFDGSTDLSGYQTLILQLGYNWGYGDMPQAGQDQLLAWVDAGGGLVTGEWLSYMVYYGAFVTLEPALPFAATGFYDSTETDTYTQVTGDATINLGLPESFDFPLVNYDGGTEGELVPKQGATVYYDSANLDAGLLGWQHGHGRVLSFSGTLGPDQVSDAEFGMLLSNAAAWAAGDVRCYADFTGDGALDLFDFLAFVNTFNAGDPDADCDDGGTFDLFDFLCFTNAFNAGC